MQYNVYESHCRIADTNLVLLAQYCFLYIYRHDVSASVSQTDTQVVIRCNQSGLLLGSKRDKGKGSF